MESLTEFETKLQRAWAEAVEHTEQDLIRDEENWDFLMALLIKLKLMSLDDQVRLSCFKPSFPCTFTTFL